MWRETEKFCRDCVACARAKQATARLTGELRASSLGRPWQRITTDFIGPLPMTPRGNTYVLTFYCAFTGWPEAFATVDCTHSTFAEKFIAEVIARHDPPDEILSDNGSAYVADGIARVMELVGVRHLFTPTYHPQSNSSERLNKTLETLLRPMVEDHPTDWDLYLPMALRAIRTAVNPRTGFTPYYLMFGRNHTAPVDLALGLKRTEVSPQDYAVDVVGNLRVALEVAAKSSDLAREATQRSLDKRSRSDKFEIGDLVMVEVQGSRSKLSYPYTGPFKVLKPSGATMVVVDLPAGPTNVHLQRIKRFLGAEPIAPTLDVALDEEMTVDPPDDISHSNIIGRRVRVYWPTLRDWYDGTVVKRDKRRHIVLYDSDGEEYYERLIGYGAYGAKWKLLVPVVGLPLDEGVQILQRGGV